MRVARSPHMQTAEGSVPVLDHAVLSELETLGADIVAEIVDLFLGDFPERLRKLQQAVNVRSKDAVLREAHGLKGSALAVGAARLASLCAAMECDARDGLLDRAAGQLFHLEPEFAKVRSALREPRQ